MPSTVEDVTNKPSSNVMGMMDALAEMQCRAWYHRWRTMYNIIMAAVS